MRNLPTIGLVALLSAFAGCRRAECLDAVLAPPERTERFAFIASDFTSSVLGVLDTQGEVISPPLISSGSVPPGALTGLSGDVVFASKQTDGQLLYIERLGADLITEVSRTIWFVEQQSRVSRLGVDGSTFSANPHDMLAIGNDYWVTRHNPNTEPSADATEGNDIAIVSRPDGILSATISLLSANTTAEGKVIYARPERMVFVPGDGNSSSGIVAIGLARLSDDFMVAGPGAVALVDIQDQFPNLVPLDPLTNCGEIRAVLDQPTQILAVCKGSTFEGPEARRATSGVVLIDVQTQQILEVWYAEDHFEVLPPQHGLISLGAGQLAVVGLSEGDDATLIESQLIAIDLRTQTTMLIASSVGEQLGFGAGAYDPETKTLLVPDSNRSNDNPDTIRRFDHRGGLEFTERPLLPGLGCDELAVREIALLSLPTDE